MATIVCQGLESQQLCEPRTTLRLKLSSQKQQPFDFAFKSCFFDSNTNQSPLNKPKHSFSFLEAITSNTKNQNENRDQVYVHPLSKRSVSSLSEKSLKLCTENLGSETGTDIIEDDALLFSRDFNSLTDEEENSRFEVKRSVKSRSDSNFPPPLTTITGMESVQVRTHREDGRLILKAVKAPSPHSLFQTERSHGRLRLTMFKDSVFDSDKTEQETEEVDEVDEPEDEETSVDDDIDEDETTNQELVKEDQQEVVVVEEETQDITKEGRDEENYEDVKGKRKEVEGKMGMMEKYYRRRRGRCMEEETTSSSVGGGGEIGISIWEANIKPVWVATS